MVCFVLREGEIGGVERKTLLRERERERLRKSSGPRRATKTKGKKGTREREREKEKPQIHTRKSEDWRPPG